MRLGLTGGIGSGKSTVAAWWAVQGATVVDTDALARELTAPGGTALPAIMQAFGPEFILRGGGLDRERMRAHVLARPDARRKLEAILHPGIQKEAEARAAQAEGWVVFDVPLLVESRNWRQRVARVLVVDCDEHVQLMRVSQRPGWSMAQAKAVLAVQSARSQRRAAADACLDNSLPGIDRLHQSLQLLAAHWGFRAGAVEESRP